MELAREPIFRLGSMEVRPSTREILFGGGREVLEPRVMTVLIVLARAGGEVVTREDLTTACWEGRVVSDDAINRVISRIRRVSDLTGGQDFTLETITKVGYRLVVNGLAPAPPAPARADPAPEPEAPARPRRLVIPVAILSALAVLVATGAWWLAGRETGWRPDPKASLTVAVLPFDNLGTNKDDDVLAIGMSREIRNTLSRVRGLKVVSDSSSFAVAAQHLGAVDIRKTLWADLLVDGSMRRIDANRVKLTAELVDARTGNNLWTGEQEGAASDLNSVQLLLSSAIFEQIVGRAGPNRLEQLAPPRPSDTRVYRLVVEGSELMNRARELLRHGVREEAYAVGDVALAKAREALNIDPNSAGALTLIGTIAESATAREFADDAIPAANRLSMSVDYMRRALAQDPDNVTALQKLAENYRRNDWRWADSEALFRRALALNPNDSLTRIFYAFYLSGVGRCAEGLDQAEQAVQLDPVWLKADLTKPRMLTCLGRLEEADRIYAETLDSDRTNLFVLTEMYLRLLARRDVPALRRLADHVATDLWKGAPPEGVGAILKRATLGAEALEGRPKAYLDLLVAEIEAFNRRPEQLRAAQGRRSADVRWTYAVELAAAGDVTRAIEMLQTALSGGSLYIPDTMPYGLTEFTPEVRADPRYQLLWRNDPRLVEMVRLRLESLKAGQMAGVLPDGTRVLPESAVDTRS